MVLEVQGATQVPDRVKGRTPCRGQRSLKLLNLQEFRDSLKVFLAAVTVNLEKKKSINAFYHSTNNKKS